jgi:hypothetical protein
MSWRSFEKRKKLSQLTTALRQQMPKIRENQTEKRYKFKPGQW